MIKKQFLKSKSVCEVTFTLPKEAAVDAKEVKVLGDFNDWKWDNGVSMKTKNDVYTAVVELEVGRDYQFRYLIDQKRWENDWQADAYARNVFGGSNSVVLVPSVEGIPVSKVVEKVAVAKETVKVNGVAPVKEVLVDKVVVEEKAVVEKVKAEPKKVVVAKKVVEEKVVPAVEPKKVVAKKVTKKKRGKFVGDDFRKIEGIGPKIMSVLKEAGLKTYEMLAETSVEDLKTILITANKRYKMHNPTTWPKQADMAAKNEWDALKKWQDELDGGKPAK